MSRFPANLLVATAALTTAAANVTVNGIILPFPGIANRYRLRALSVARIDVAGATTAWHGAITNDGITAGYMEATSNGHDSKLVPLDGGLVVPANTQLRFTWLSNLVGAEGRAKLYYTVERVS